jgi:hypothetical protein
MQELPAPIIREVMHWQRELRWPELVPKYAEIPDANGKILWHLYAHLTTALCEQATEFHVRKGRAAIRRWHTNCSLRTARTAARHIVWARIYRCRYLDLCGIGETCTEDDMPSFISEDS